MLPYVSGQAAGSTWQTLDTMPGAYVESNGLTDTFLTDLRLDRAQVSTPSGPAEGMKQEVLWQRWEREQDEPTEEGETSE